MESHDQVPLLVPFCSGQEGRGLSPRREAQRSPRPVLSCPESQTQHTPLVFTGRRQKSVHVPPLCPARVRLCPAHSVLLGSQCLRVPLLFLFLVASCGSENIVRVTGRCSKGACVLGRWSYLLVHFLIFLKNLHLYLMRRKYPKSRLFPRE